MSTQTVAIEVDHTVAEILQKLKARADAQGVSLSFLLQPLVIEDYDESTKTFFERTPEERATAFLQWAESHRITASTLSGEAISRESIYADREDRQL